MWVRVAAARGASSRTRAGLAPLVEALGRCLALRCLFRGAAGEPPPGGAPEIVALTDQQLGDEGARPLAAFFAARLPEAADGDEAAAPKRAVPAAHHHRLWLGRRRRGGGAGSADGALVAAAPAPRLHARGTGVLWCVAAGSARAALLAASRLRPQHLDAMVAQALLDCGEWVPVC